MDVSFVRKCVYVLLEKFPERIEIGDDPADVVVIPLVLELFRTSHQELLHLHEDAPVEIFGMALDQGADLLLDHRRFPVAREPLELEDAARVVIGYDAQADFRLYGVEIAPRFLDVLRAFEMDDELGDSQEIFREMGQPDIGGEEELDIHPFLREEPAADHVVEKIARVEAIFAEEKDRKGAGSFRKIGPGDKGQHVGEAGPFCGKPQPLLLEQILRDEPLDQVLRPIAVIFSLDIRTPELEVKL